MKKIEIKSKKDILQAMSGVLLIFLTFLANGFLSFLVVGLDFANILTGEYWANFITLTLSEIAVLFGMFIIQRGQDLQHNKIIELQKHIDQKREQIYHFDKTTEAEEWLRDVYNYRERLFLYEEKVKLLHSKITLVEPKTTDKNYDKLKAKYDKAVEKKEYLKQQLSFIKKDKERLRLLIGVKTEEHTKTINTLSEELESEEYGFKTAKLHYRDVFWGNLLSDAEESKLKDNSPFFNEKKELTKSILKYVGLGLMSSAVLSAFVFGGLKGLSWATVVSMLIHLIMLIFFMARGIRLSHKIILGTYYKALEKRKSIYNQMQKDLHLTKIEIVEEVVENEQENI